MALMPKRVKHRKSQRGRIRGDASRGNRVVFGDFGLQAEQPGWLPAATIEAGRIAAQQYLRNEGRLFVRVFPHKSITSIPLETRMGKGKGEPEYWAAVIKPGVILYEMLAGQRPFTDKDTRKLAEQHLHEPLPPLPAGLDESPLGQILRRCMAKADTDRYPNGIELFRALDEIGKALGVEYNDDEELQGGDEIAARDHDRWELDPASSDDFDER